MRKIKRRQMKLTYRTQWKHFHRKAHTGFYRVQCSYNHVYQPLMCKYVNLNSLVFHVVAFLCCLL